MDQNPLSGVVPTGVSGDIISACKQYLADYLAQKMTKDEFIRLCLSVAPQRPQSRWEYLDMIQELKHQLAELPQGATKEVVGAIRDKISKFEGMIYAFDYWHNQEVKYGVVH